MRSSFTAHGNPNMADLKLTRTPSAREQSTRRRLAALAAVLGLALVSGLLGVFTVPKGPIEPAARTGPFSYFPS